MSLNSPKKLVLANTHSNKWRSRAFKILKRIYLLTKIKKPRNQTILFIIGCQRSGTTLLTRIFDRDVDMKVFWEFSELSSLDVDKIRLNPLGLVKMVFNKQKASSIVAKPLVETQNALKLLEYFQNSKALWVYRDYKDVASSNITKFGPRNGITDLQPIVQNDAKDWRSESISEYTKRIVNKHYSENMNPNDACALFWFVRNTLFFQLNLNDNPRVMMCRYENLVQGPSKLMKTLYQWIGAKYPGDSCVRNVHTASLGRGKHLHLSPEVDLLCKELLDKLNNTYSQNPPKQ